MHIQTLTNIFKDIKRKTLVAFQLLLETFINPKNIIMLVISS